MKSCHFNLIRRCLNKFTLLLIIISAALGSVCYCAWQLLIQLLSFTSGQILLSSLVASCLAAGYVRIYKRRHKRILQKFPYRPWFAYNRQGQCVPVILKPGKRKRHYHYYSQLTCRYPDEAIRAASKELKCWVALAESGAKYSEKELKQLAN